MPSVRKLPHKDQDMRNLISLLSTLIDCKLTLGELLKIHPHLWNELAAILEKMGIKEIKPEALNRLQNENKTHAQVQPVPVNKVGD